MHAKPECGHTQLHDSCAHCQGLQKYWYGILWEKGFSEIENVTNPSRPLKSPSGMSVRVIPRGSDESVDIIDLVIAQEPHFPIQNSFPESPISSQERLLFHPEFDRVCADICRHGNHCLGALQVKGIWMLYIEGKSNRAIAGRLSINDTLVWRTINTLSQYMGLMDLEEEEKPQLAKVVLREYRPKGPKGDEGFIYGTWRNALWFDNENRKEGESDRFFRAATQSIRRILESPETRVRIACLDDSDILIVGYSVITGNLLHFIYVKPDYRNKRIGSLLVPQSVERVSPIMTKVGRAIAIKKKFIKENQHGKTEGLEE